MEASKLLKEKRFWFASVLIAWAAGLQGHMMWMQRQDSFKQKFGDLNQSKDADGDLNADV
ncbi:uncharacterized protein LOC120264234 [Dioscorea cayenensis subsp. rotundata]|uniref:Uncharacterized protein LOC120264234 n=1 Tax=Dioscorea cayennensis subsp. rotundata TaxID=55577 RepID=A0AB40BNT2_DIOCR|nr:uncharacterized protein LOC120264234 [Dioscorea cayenensis subsp. rotundata]XP_039127969.1 uncharacterized protein LOC120264234 [Dioscorea cayenensis subsp. rotundata]XP_039127970.1 uncharacterized protein LOC120264234 [Dioscorea cayenensis subsp. rotundata]